MRRIKERERRRGGNIYCQFCKEDGRRKVDALWRNIGLTASFACDEHRSRLERVVSESFSEADYQTWMRL